MKLTLLFACLLAIVAVSFVQADLQDEIDSALKKFCGGIALTGPKKGQTFSNPKKIKVTVTRKPNAQAKVIQGVDAYSIDSKGKPKYLKTVWKGNFNLQKKASLTVDISKLKVKFPGQFEFRVWVHNKSGPDCTLMSKVFKVKSSSHSNAVDEADYKNLPQNIDRGCFGVELVAPGLGEDVTADSPFKVQIKRDTAAHTETVNKLELYKVDLDTRVSEKVQDSWNGPAESIHNLFIVKDTVPAAAKTDNVAFFYKLAATAQENESCEYFSHPFYVV